MTNPLKDASSLKAPFLFPYKAIFLLAFSFGVFVNMGYSQDALFTSSIISNTLPSPNYKGIPKNTLSLLSWNIQLLPSIMINKGQVKRAKAIAMVLSDVNYDVIIIQEAFHRRGRRILSRALSKHYPHQHGPGKGGLIKINSGVWILSRLPLTNRKSIKFSKCKCLFQDCRANKGALFVELEKNGQKIQLIATHVQAEKGTQFDAIRYGQFMEIEENFISPYKGNKVPNIIVGDLNTFKYPNNKEYDDMLDVLEASDIPITGEFKFTYGGKPNDLIGKEVVEGKVIDYVLFNSKKSPVVHEYNRVKIFRKKWKKNKFDLSDHYALEANFIISNEK